ncbi:MAG: DUF4375 domain-containing protein [Planctomycetaceae bacterium]
MCDELEAIYCWTKLLCEVNNGGFTQFFYNRAGETGIEELAQFLDELQLPEESEMIWNAISFFDEHEEEFELVKDPVELFGSFDELNQLDKQFFSINHSITLVMENWIRKECHKIIVSESGNRIDNEFSGKVEEFYPSGQLLRTLEVNNGRASGVYQEYSEDGTSRIIISINPM